jgi:ribosome-binding ATPase
MKIGIVGLPQSGKTTLYNALTGQQVSTAAYSGGKEDAHHAVIRVPDERLEQLNDIFAPQKKVPATIEYIDLAGIHPDQQKKQGFSDHFLGQLRLVDAILIVLRSFENPNVAHTLGSLDPNRDLDIILSEFIISDMSIIENRLDRLERQMRVKKNDQDVKEHTLLQGLLKQLEEEIPLRNIALSVDEQHLIRGYQFLTQKPLILVLNIDENQLTDDTTVSKNLKVSQEKNTAVLTIAAQIEMEIQQLEGVEAELFRTDLGIKDSAMEKLVRISYDLLGLISFFTVGEDEVRAWTVPENTKAPLAAGTIHSDFEKGFIRAEAVHYDDFIERKSLAKCKSDGVMRLEGRDYTVKDGDIITFRFAV